MSGSKSTLTVAPSQTPVGPVTIASQGSFAAGGTVVTKQGSFDPRNDAVSILQVVRNPSWLTPYIACSLVGMGLLYQFLSHLVAFAKKRRTA